MMDAKETVEILGACTEDVGVCEIMRAAIANKSVDTQNERVGELRNELAKVACLDCQQAYLSDVRIDP